MNFIKQYKDKIASRYIPIASDAIAMKVIESDYYYSSIKHDGFFGVLVITNGMAQLYNKSGKLLACPTITSSSLSGVKNAILAGEICVFKDNKSTSHAEVARAIANPEKQDLRFGVFDILEIDGNPLPTDLKEKIKLMQELIKEPGAVFCIEQNYFESRKDIVTFYESVAADYEGVVVKSANGIINKIKKTITLDLVVLGYAETNDPENNTLRELLLGVVLDDGNFQILTKCGTGYKDAERKSILETLQKTIVPSEFTEVSGTKTAFVMVKPEMVVEISCLDLNSTTINGSIRKPVLNFSTDKGYTIIDQSNTLSCFAPVFVKIRDDKQANSKDAGALQAYAIVSPEEETSGVESSVLSEIILREVYCKEGKTATAVRKIMGIKTNKENTGLYAPYMVVYTDFSADRSSPLDQDVFLSYSEEEMKTTFEAVKLENIKKGWQLNS
jgi:hypothetical protein